MNLTAGRSESSPGNRLAYAPGERPVEGWIVVAGLGSNHLGESYLAEDAAGRRAVLRRSTDTAKIAPWGVERIVGKKHPHLAEAIERPVSTTGDTWLARRFVAGRNLADVLATREGGMPLKEALRWMEGIAAGLRFLQAQQSQHGRLKPANVWIGKGVVTLTDFALPPAAANPLSASSRYAAPETARGRFDQADLYACGALLVEMLTGRIFDAAEAWPVRLAEPYRPILARVLDPDPSRRFASLDELLQALRAAPQNLPPPAPQPPPPAPLWIVGESAIAELDGDPPQFASARDGAEAMDHRPTHQPRQFAAAIEADSAWSRIGYAMAAFLLVVVGVLSLGRAIVTRSTHPEPPPASERQRDEVRRNDAEGVEEVFRP